MMRCNKCGASNEDDARFCLSCGHKLRSRSSEPQEGGQTPEGQDNSERLSESRTSGSCHGCGKYVESAIYATVLAAGVVISLVRAEPLALYILAGVVGLVAWLRRI